MPLTTALILLVSLAAGAGAAAPYTVVLGIAQDAGYPQAGCRRDCCAAVWRGEESPRHVACLAIVDPVSGRRWLIDATPDLREQLHVLDEIAAPPDPAPGLAGILLTHGHIGHYTGLMFLGHESIGARGVPVYAMPRMRGFLSANGPWDQLVRYGNIRLAGLEANEPVALDERITVTPLPVPHRQEYTEAVGFRIRGPHRAVLYVPDIDRWDGWTTRLEDALATVDVAYLDGTFFAEGELPGRDMSRIPHPLITATMQRLAPLPPEARAKVRFIHLNHTNPALRSDGPARKAIRAAGFHIAAEGERESL